MPRAVNCISRFAFYAWRSATVRTGRGCYKGLTIQILLANNHEAVVARTCSSSPRSTPYVVFATTAPMSSDLFMLQGR